MVEDHQQDRNRTKTFDVGSEPAIPRRRSRLVPGRRSSCSTKSATLSVISPTPDPPDPLSDSEGFTLVEHHGYSPKSFSTSRLIPLDVR